MQTRLPRILIFGPHGFRIEAGPHSQLAGKPVSQHTPAKQFEEAALAAKYSAAVRVFASGVDKDVDKNWLRYSSKDDGSLLWSESGSFDCQ